MTREKKLMLNSLTSIIYQLVTMVCGFILPRMFLTHFGSEVNGLVSSITQFLGFISLAECGVGAVVQSTLYVPLAKKDNVEISKIFISSEKFFKKILYLLTGYIIVLIVVFPFITNSNFGWGYTSLLIFILSINTFAQYYLGMTYRLILNADQYGFVQYLLNIVTLIINTICCVILITMGSSIHVVKGVSAIIFLIQPIVLVLYAKKRYKIDKTIKLTEEPIKQKWNGFAQHIATVVLNNTDTVVLTILSTLKMVSVYSVYYLVINGVTQLTRSATNGIQAMFGNMLAKGEMQELKERYDRFEWLMHTLVVVIFMSTALLIVPFALVYTKGVTDTNYNVPIFAYLITLAQATYCLRLPYNIMILAAGHYKETQQSAIIEAILNVIISVALVYKFDLIGVAIGTFIAMAYRTIYFVIYLSNNIIERKVKYFNKQLFVDFLTVIVIIGITKLCHNIFVIKELTYISWVILAIKIFLLVVMVSFVVNLIFYNKRINIILNKQSKEEK